VRQVVLADRFTRFLVSRGNLQFRETNLALKRILCQPAQVLLILLLAARLANAQGGYPKPPPPPPGAKSTKCSGRPIPHFGDVTAEAGITALLPPTSFIPFWKAPELCPRNAFVQLRSQRPNRRLAKRAMPQPLRGRVGYGDDSACGEIAAVGGSACPGLSCPAGISSHKTVAVVSFRNVPRPMYR